MMPAPAAGSTAAAAFALLLSGVLGLGGGVGRRNVRGVLLKTSTCFCSFRFPRWLHLFISIPTRALAIYLQSPTTKGKRRRYPFALAATTAATSHADPSINKNHKAARPPPPPPPPRPSQRVMNHSTSCAFIVSLTSRDKSAVATCVKKARAAPSTCMYFGNGGGGGGVLI